MAIHDWKVADTKFAVIDVETTGLSSGQDQIIEVAVVHVQAGREPELVLDTIVRPSRKVAGTEIHGINDNNLRSAPSFKEVAPHLLQVFAGRVLASHNVYFDLRFLAAELEDAGYPAEFPYLSTMYLAPMLDAGDRCSLASACEAHGVTGHVNHHAGHDAMATAQLLTHYLAKCEALEVRAFKDLTARHDHNFTQSFRHSPSVAVDGSLPVLKTVSRRDDASRKGRQNPGLQRYYDSLLAAVADLAISGAEKKELAGIVKQHNVSKAHVRALHARVYAAQLNDFINDEVLDQSERTVIRKLRGCLKKLGWAPGQ